MTIPLLFEDEQLIVVNKLAGQSFHSESNEIGMFAQIEKQFGDKLWPVHRLDKMTSGILLCAKDASAAAALGALFADRQVHKTYLAISDRAPKKKQGKIIGDMLKSRNGSWKLSPQKQHPAVTQFRSTSLQPGSRLYLLHPRTGKTHQLRVAMKSIGAPILGDQRYGGSEADRGYLHAYQLQFHWQNREYQFTTLPLQGEHFLSTAFSNALQHVLCEKDAQ